MPPPSTQDVRLTQARLTVAQNRRNPLNNTLNHLRSEQSRKNGEISNLRGQIRYTAQEAQKAIQNNLVEERRRNETRITEMNWGVSRLTREWEELGVRIENVNKDIRELDQEISGLENMLNVTTGANWTLGRREGGKEGGGCGGEWKRSIPLSRIKLVLQLYS